MKIHALLLIVLMICVSPAAADTYVKQQTHRDAYYYGGIVTPEENQTVEIWIGDNKMAYIEPRQLIIVNLAANSLIFANRSESTYAETTLPLQWTNLLEEEAAARVLMFQRHGTLEETAETGMFQGKTCKCYKFTSWIPYQDVKYDEREGKIWISTDAPFSDSAYERTRVHFLELQNYVDEYVTEAAGVKGFPLYQETEVYMKGFSVKSYEKVVEISEKEPPEGLYSVPFGFRKKDRLSIQDVSG